MTELNLQKQLLVAESEVNRVMLLQEGRALVTGLQPFVQTARKVGDFASSAAAGITAISELGLGRNGSSTGKPSWWQTIYKGARLGLSAWLVFRRAGGNEP